LEIQKRHTLNWLIQGAAQHAGMTFQYLVRDELNALDPRLLTLYDQYALINLLQYWLSDGSLVFGWPPRFWRQASTKPSHPFFGHPLLSKYGGLMAEGGRRRGLERCKEKGLSRIPVLFSLHAQFVMQRLRSLEAPHRPRLAHLAKRTASTVWGIPYEQLDGELSAHPRVHPGKLPIRSFRSSVFMACIVG
jgi:hypothetical protein